MVDGVRLTADDAGISHRATESYDGKQILEGLLLFFRMIGVFQQSFPDILEILIFRGLQVPVSYTHLDVYKRQGILIRCQMNRQGSRVSGSRFPRK